MQLYVWPCFSPDYYDGLAFAIAKDEKQAKKLIIKQYGLNPSNWGLMEVYPIDKPIAFARSGGG